MLTPQECGITRRHISHIKRVAQTEKCFILVRPVNEFSTGLIDAGCATKKLDIHAKSSDWGPMAGFICRDQALSKVAGDTTKVAKGNRDAEDSVRTRGIGATPLRISATRVSELQRLTVPGSSENVIPPGNWTTGAAFRCRRGPVERSFRLKKVDSTGDLYEVEYETSTGWQPVEVIGYGQPGAIIPVTADYDLFAVCPHFSADRSLSRVITLRERDGEGMLTDFQRRVKDEINNRVGGPAVVNHGTELNNPFPENDPTLAMFTPAGMSRMVQRVKLYDIFADMAQRGFHVYTNRQWHVAHRSRINSAVQQRLLNPLRRGDLAPRVLEQGDFNGLDLRSYPVGTTHTDKMEHFASAYLDGRTSGEKPGWR